MKSSISRVQDARGWFGIRPTSLAVVSLSVASIATGSYLQYRKYHPDPLPTEISERAIADKMQGATSAVSDRGEQRARRSQGDKKSHLSLIENIRQSLDNSEGSFSDLKEIGAYIEMCGDLDRKFLVDSLIGNLFISKDPTQDLDWFLSHMKSIKLALKDVGSYRDIGLVDEMENGLCRKFLSDGKQVLFEHYYADLPAGAKKEAFEQEFLPFLVAQNKDFDTLSKISDPEVRASTQRKTIDIYLKMNNRRMDALSCYLGGSFSDVEDRNGELANEFVTDTWYEKNKTEISSAIDKAQDSERKSLLQRKIEEIPLKKTGE